MAECIPLMAEIRAAAIAELEKELVSSGGSGDLITEDRKKVLALTPSELLLKLREGSLTAVLTLEAFQAKAIEETRRTNCVTEFIPSARKLAENLDSTFSSSSDVLPLRGLPISVKDVVEVKGHDATHGLRKRVGHPAEADSSIVAIFKKLGAVPFVITNIPQLCMSLGCSNPVWGETVNPFDLGRSCGGSSGGEAALISGGGSVLGIGTDIGGSVRLPSSFCGTVGLKPTSRRTSNIGVMPAIPGLVGISGTVGVMGRDVPIVVEATRAIFSGEMALLDSEVPPVPWREALFTGQTKKSLRIGWYDTDGLFPVTPGIKRAVSEAAAAMKGLGHELIPFTVPNPIEAMKLFMDFVNADQGKHLDDHLKDETVDPTLTWLNISSHIPSQLRTLAEPLLKQRFGEIVSKLVISTIGSVDDLWRRLAQQQAYAGLFRSTWKKSELDLLLCPVFPTPALKRDATMISIMTCAVTYTSMYNLLDYPAASVPITKENEEDQRQLQDFAATDYLHQQCKESTQGAQGLPLSVQLVALPYCEELLCRAMLDLSRAVNFNL